MANIYCFLGTDQGWGFDWDYELYPIYPFGDDGTAAQGQVIDAASSRQRIAPYWQSYIVHRQRFVVEYFGDERLVPPWPVDFPDFAAIPGKAVSERAKRLILEMVPENSVEFLPFAGDGKGYYLMNVLDVVDCVDRSRAKLLYTANGSVASIRNYAFLPGSVGNRHLFREPLAVAQDLLVSEDFVRMVERNGLTGTNFKFVGEAD